MLRELSPGLDGSVVLRYHSVPCLTSQTRRSRCEPEYREDDPVPFIRLRPPPGPATSSSSFISPSGVSRLGCPADRQPTATADARKRIA